MTKQYKNVSGSALSAPTVSEYDVAPDEIIDVADDVLMPAEYFELQE